MSYFILFSERDEAHHTHLMKLADCLLAQLPTLERLEFKILSYSVGVNLILRDIVGVLRLIAQAEAQAHLFQSFGNTHVASKNETNIVHSIKIELQLWAGAAGLAEVFDELDGVFGGGTSRLWQKLKEVHFLIHLHDFDSYMEGVEVRMRTLGKRLKWLSEVGVLKFEVVRV